MASSALWTAAHMGIPLLVVIANNGCYYNDVAHQERVATVRERPLENKLVGQEIAEPAVDLVGIAKSFGIATEPSVTNPTGLRAALARGEAACRAGRPYFIDARIDVSGETTRGHTGGRK
jgi:benzoylformate decarboxylase